MLIVDSRLFFLEKERAGTIVGYMSIVDSNVGTNESAEENRQVSVDADLRLVERVKAGDMSAFDALTKKYRERLYGVVYNMISNREDAMDIVQDSFIKAFSAINSFKGNSAFYTWLYRIAVNRAITFMKRSRLRRFFSLDDSDETLAPDDVLEKLSVNCGGEKKLLLNELKEKLNEALQTLSIKHRTVVVLFEIEGLSHQEIAEITNTSEATVRTRLHYAKQQLRTYLKDYLK